MEEITPVNAPNVAQTRHGMVAAPMSTPLSEDGDGVAIIIERHARITDGGNGGSVPAVPSGFNARADHRWWFNAAWVAHSSGISYVNSGYSTTVGPSQCGFNARADHRWWFNAAWVAHRSSQCK